MKVYTVIMILKKRICVFKSLIPLLCILFFSTSCRLFNNPKTACDSSIKNTIRTLKKNSPTNHNEPGDFYTQLKNFAVYLKENNKPCSTIVKQLNQRFNTLHDTVLYTFDTSTMTFVGSPSSPDRIIIFVSASCPMCKFVYKGLYDSVVAGSLKGKALLGIKTFTSQPGDLALIAARKFGKQADLMLSLSSANNRISLDDIFKKADSLGMPLKAFEKEFTDLRTEDAALESWKEAVGNGVITTPSIFINGHFYDSSKDPRWIVDAVKYYSLTQKK